MTKLPSALELLETTEAPSFLSVPSHQPAFDVQPMKAPERCVGWLWVDECACMRMDK